MQVEKEIIMPENKKSVCCTYRSWVIFLTIAVSLPFYCLTLYCTIKFKVGWILCVSVVALIYVLYFVMKMLNCRVIMTEDKLIVYNLFRCKRVYEIRNISKVIVLNNMNTRYLLIRIGKNKVKIRKDAKGYSDFLKAFCQKLKIEGYSRGGKNVFDIQK